MRNAFYTLALVSVEVLSLTGAVAAQPAAMPESWFPEQQTPATAADRQQQRGWFPEVSSSAALSVSAAVATATPASESTAATRSASTTAAHSTSPWLLGAFYRHNFIPPFILDIFTEEMTGVNNPSAGLELTREFERFDVIASVWWQNFHAYEPFRDDGDAVIETEMIDSKLWTVFAGVSVLGTVRLHRTVAFQYGGDFGFGVVGGSLHRTDAYRDAQGNWAPCDAPGVPNSEYCASPAVGDDSRDGGHYNVRARRWAEGGVVPNVWLRVAPHIAFKFTPHDRVAIRVDSGLDIFSGFFLGAAASVRLGSKSASR